MAWLLLAVAIAAEVAGTLSLRVATVGPSAPAAAAPGSPARGRPRWYVAVVAGYLLSFTMLALSLRAGMPLGVAYGVWTAVGVALVAIAGRVLFRERFTWMMALGVALIAGGVLLVEAGAHIG